MLIGELSRRTGVSSRLLRYYEAQGLLDAERGPNGYRDYTADSVAAVRKVRALLAAGLSTEVIRSVLPCVRGEGVREGVRFAWCEEIRSVLDGELAAMDARIEGLRHNRDTLACYLHQA
ncbi:MerR family transcriptional regulator [Streptomyces sp. NPDC048257]|uniref:MerR family transcriptional regulator n=1 Tax=Streptomyces sp. NPDC048257 TaxID=3365526 RepID=UPI0037143787